MRNNSQKTVFLGMSGGVDSSVSAYLLKQEGYNVVGVFIQVWQPEGFPCTAKEDRLDAMRVAAQLDIPFLTLDLEAEYKKGVIDYMLEEYKKGNTPNPDVMCNKEVKFGAFLNWAQARGADYVATGHYAQNISDQLVKGIDESKDQSYFLWTLTQKQLNTILFPIGHMQKRNVRKLASWYKLPTAIKKDSQGICFIGEIDMKDFLKHYIDEKSGNVINEQNEVIGRHNGVLLYTLGERHGFTIIEKGTRDLPYYIIKKDIKQNILVVSQTINVVKGVQKIELIDCVWRGIPTKKSYTAQIRYHGDFKTCTLNKTEKNTYTVVFDYLDTTIAPGQSVVVYDHSVCIGGGIVA